MEYGCIGERLIHSFSKDIHEQIENYKYELKELVPDEFDKFMRKHDFKAINVTIPYKEKVIPYLYKISDNASKIGAVNTVVNRDGKLYGYNTDYMGLNALLRRFDISLIGKKVLILGTGGTSKTAFAVASDANAREVYCVSRTKKNDSVSYDEAMSIHSDADIIINTTPSGMYPKIFDIPINLDKFPKVTGVIDVVYNPLRTELVLSAEKRRIPVSGGLYMLVAQAILASQIFCDTELDTNITEKIYRQILSEKENIVLIGMPTSGKTTIGKLISENTGRKFIDIDEEIQLKSSISPSDMIKNYGIKAFRDIESEIVKSTSSVRGAVIATGGGVALFEENVKNLRKNGRLYWINRSVKNLFPTQDRPLSDDRDKLLELYNERKDIYLAASDDVINGDREPKSIALDIERRHKR